MKHPDYIKIFTGDRIIIQRIIFDLENENIRPVIKDDTESARLAGFGTNMQGKQEILVHKEELDKALSIIENTTSEFQE